MASITITLTDICAGGNHLTYSVTGAKTLTVAGLLEDLSSPVTDDDAQVFLKVVAKLAKSGRTVAQTRSLLQSGVVVTI